MFSVQGCTAGRSNIEQWLVGSSMAKTNVSPFFNKERLRESEVIREGRAMEVGNGSGASEEGFQFKVLGLGW